jgi:hypothetical protein
MSDRIISVENARAGDFPVVNDGTGDSNKPTIVANRWRFIRPTSMPNARPNGKSEFALALTLVISSFCLDWIKRVEFSSRVVHEERRRLRPPATRRPVKREVDVFGEPPHAGVRAIDDGSGCALPLRISNRPNLSRSVLRARANASPDSKGLFAGFGSGAR